MKNYKTGIDRNQLILIQTNLDDKIERDNPVRAIDKIVDEMDVYKLGFKYSQISKVGRTSYDPADMLKLYLYCYFFGIRSSRKIERECKVNVELMWLVKELSPDHKTIANFRHDNKEAIEKSFKYFILLCADLGLLGKTLVAVDGSKFKANSSNEKYVTKKYAEQKINNLKTEEEEIKKYLKLLEKNDDDDDKNPPPSFNKNDITNKLKNIKEKIKEFEGIEKNGGVSFVDTDAKMMKSRALGIAVCFNVQAAVDEKNKIVVAVDVTNDASDYRQLYNISSKAKENLEVTDITIVAPQGLLVVADGGYYSAMEFAKCDEENILPVVPKPLLKSTPDENYSKDKFIYDTETDEYTCPQGAKFTTKHFDNSKDKIYQNKKVCINCLSLEKCTTRKYRVLRDPPNQKFAHVVDRRTKENISLVKMRKAIIESVFGTVKYNFGFSYFLTRNLTNVRTETFLHFLIYNLKRMINILGTSKILQSI